MSRNPLRDDGESGIPLKKEEEKRQPLDGPVPKLAGVCMQCMATAMTTGAAVSGARAWLGTRNFRWLTPVRLRRITVSLFAAGLLASALLVSGSGAPGGHPSQGSAPGATISR